MQRTLQLKKITTKVLIAASNAEGRLFFNDHYTKCKQKSIDMIFNKMDNLLLLQSEKAVNLP